jgi:hypothetical protein
MASPFFKSNFGLQLLALCSHIPFDLPI